MSGEESVTSQATSSWDFRDFSLSIQHPPPAEYPVEDQPDTFVEEAPVWQGPLAWNRDYEARRLAYLDFCVTRPAPPMLKAPFYELPRAAAGLSVHEGILHAGLDYIEARRDCSDFLAHAYLRHLLTPYLVTEPPTGVAPIQQTRAALVQQTRASPRLSPELFKRIDDVLFSFKYWPDEPGDDSLCTWTENHQILYASAALVLGLAAPDRVFCNSGRTGAEQAERFRPRVLRWLDLRFRTGFSEWLSNVYYDEDLAALLTLVDFSDEETASRAKAVADVLFLDMALHTCRGVFGSSHGRSYEEQKKFAGNEAVSDTLKLAFGVGCWCRHDNMSAVCLALSSNYRPPAAIAAIVSAQSSGAAQAAEIRQRMGIRVDEAGRWGLGYESLEDGMVFLGMEAYNHPRTINLTFRLFDAFRWWQNNYFSPFSRVRGLIGMARRLGLMPLVARLLGRDINRNAREEVNLYTWKTPDYSLGSAQDWCFRRGGDQQSIWQATLGNGAVCFTTHPGDHGERSPGYWTGSGSLPRVAQYRNILCALYDIDTRPGLYHTNRLVFTHAWLPEDQFDEVRLHKHWTFARRGNAYLALACDRDVIFTRDDGKSGPRNELIAKGRKTAWLCRLGRKADEGSFDSFVDAILKAVLSFQSGRIRFQDPVHGAIEFGRSGPFVVAGLEQVLRGYPRYDSPWAHADFPAHDVTVDCGGEHLVLQPGNAMENIGSTP